MKTIITILALLFTLNNFSQTLAFPTAKGAGAYTTGGRGGIVYHVTNLNDAGPGSLREGMLMTVPRTIVFQVSGVISLNSIIYLDATNSNLTIAGQTAPAGGITIDGSRVFFSGVDNAIIRHIRFRGGVGDNNDSFTARGGVTNQIYDHCSFSFGSDEAGSWYLVEDIATIDNVTIQKCLLAESKTGTIVGGKEGFGSAQDISVLNNLWYNVSHRFPNVSGVGDVDVINNVVWNMVKRLTRGNGSFNLNQIGNYYTYGTPIHDEILNHYSFESGFAPSIYTNGNKIVSVNGVRTGTGYNLTSSIAAMNADNFLSWKWFIDNTNSGIYGTTNRGDQLTTDFKSLTQFPLRGEPITILSADSAFVSVTGNVGCNARLNQDGSCANNIDVLDSNWLAQVNSGNYVAKMLEANYIVPAINSVTRPAGYDTDLDGMADAWETNTFGSLTRDGTLDFDADGYTDLEEFLNMVDVCSGGAVSNTCTGKNAPVATLSLPLPGIYNKSTTINFDINYTSDTTVTNVIYYLGGTALANTTTPFTFSTSGLAQGTYIVYGEVTDICGNTSNTDTVSVIIDGLLVTACNTLTQPTIDGLEDPMWSTIPSNKLGVTQNGLTFPDSTDLSASYKIAWDATSLYIFVKVKDDILFSDSDSLDFFRDDAVSIYIDGLDNNSASYDADDYYFGIRRGDNRIKINGTLYPSGGAVVKTDVITADGYDMEVKIDWNYLGLTPTVGNDIGLDFRVDDDDDGGSRENHILWNDETSTLWGDPSKFGTLKLTNTACNNTTSVKTLVEDNLVIYPNPTNGKLTITSSNEITKIEVYNSLGSLVLSRDKVRAQTQELNITNLPKGVYSIKVYEANRVVEKQIIKQ